MEQQQQSIVITRGLIGLFASLVGGSGLLLAVLIFIWESELTDWGLLALGIGVLGVIVWAAMTPQEFLAMITGRQARYGTRAIFSTLLIIGIVAMTYNLLERAVITVDMTTSNSFTLNQETIDILDQIDRPIRITGFYPASMLRDREIDDQFFRLYESETDSLITREYIDPAEQPALTAAFGAAASINTQDGDVFVSFLNEAGEVDFGSVVFVPKTDSQERDITEALVRLLSSGTFVVYFDLSLGELDPLDNTQTGMSRLNNLIRANGLITQPLDLVGLANSQSSIPADASAVVLANPRAQPNAQIIAVIDEYMQQGGSLFIMADAQSNFMVGESPFNQYLWENWGLRMMDVVVVDAIASGATPLDILSYGVSGNNAISALINPEDPNSATEFRIARAVEVQDDNPPVFNGRIIQTSPGSYGESNFEALFTRNEFEYDEDSDIVGPLTTVAFADDPEDQGGTGARIILIGDSDFVTNSQIDQPLGNAYLLTGAISWLTSFSEEVSFTPQPRVITPLVFVSPENLDLIAFITIGLIPAITLALGFGIWFWRVRR